MKTIKILFMAASTRVSLLERFNVAAENLGVKLEMYTFEEGSPWHTVGLAGLAELVGAPAFSDERFGEFLIKFVSEKKIDIVIPIIDKATVALAKITPELRASGIMPVISDLEECEIMIDKVRSDEFFRKIGLNVPSQNIFPLIAKPRFGSSSKGIVNIYSSEELELWKKRNNYDDFIVQSFINGQEYTVDAYVDARGKILGIVSRARIAVSGGEVMVARTEHNERVEKMTKTLLENGHWYGPITVQIIDDGKDAWMIECNPRFGGGVTLSIEAGLSIPEWILQEYLGLPLPNKQIEWRDGFCMTRARRDYFLWLSS